LHLSCQQLLKKLRSKVLHPKQFLYNRSMDKILLIEDDTMMSKMYEKVLSFEGFTVLLAADGEAGLELAKKEAPSLILLDIMMPKMDGLQVLGKLKAQPETQKIPVVILTNLGSDSVINEAFNIGAAGYLVKSQVSNEKLIAEVRHYIKY
jgi:two-component system, OmpR family, alkaline phosphatase synthesis response regulator PhoP